MRLSVLMSVRDAGSFLEPALESVLTQLGPEDEFLIRDDGSTDGSRKLLELAADRDGRVVLTLGEPLGLAASLNRLMAGARGEYLARMDADDISLPGRFEAQMGELEQRGLDLLSSAKAHINAAGQLIDEIAGAPQDVESLERGFNPFTHGSWMMRRNVVEQGMRYDENMPSSQDYDFLLRAQIHGYRLGLSKQISYHLRMHENSVGATRAREQMQQKLIALERYWQSSASTQRHSKLAVVHVRQGRALHALLHALMGLPSGHVKSSLRELWWHFRNH